jgi:hypothetical protein
MALNSAPTYSAVVLGLNALVAGFVTWSIPALGDLLRLLWVLSGIFDVDVPSREVRRLRSWAVAIMAFWIVALLLAGMAAWSTFRYLDLAGLAADPLWGQDFAIFEAVRTECVALLRQIIHMSFFVALLLALARLGWTLCWEFRPSFDQVAPTGHPFRVPSPWKGASSALWAARAVAVGLDSADCHPIPPSGSSPWSHWVERVVAYRASYLRPEPPQ